MRTTGYPASEKSVVLLSFWQFSGITGMKKISINRAIALACCLTVAMLALWLAVAAIHSPRIALPRVNIDPQHCDSPAYLQHYQNQRMLRERDPPGDAETETNKKAGFPRPSC
ncbi:hypothetical protein GKQ23_06885 [Erwinia sp. E602]|uniref:hypothetical protein n=1 Tax=Erwinia sp. E602 TaxID=2675378 RepID=UPI001BAB937E|nr:hypothetical protein [Erwinia sp. E602]QUG74738.1 hypothetical protein GKQ23_06885 [Erwinia sp. E602]